MFNSNDYSISLRIVYNNINKVENALVKNLIWRIYSYLLCRRNWEEFKECHELYKNSNEDQRCDLNIS